LASLSSLDEMRAKLIGLLLAPAGGLVRLLQEPAAQLARVLAAYAEAQDVAGGETAVAAE
jgi:large subunit ribosomal protein L10